MHTEVEAKKLWCPWARAIAGDADNTVVSTYNRPWISGGLAQVECACIASQCSQWRFVDQEHHRDTELWSRSKNRRVNSAWGDDAWWRPIGEDADKEPPEPVGYCGRAGKPEA